jgi:hypothetical protein
VKNDTTVNTTAKTTRAVFRLAPIKSPIKETEAGGISRSYSIHPESAKASRFPRATSRFRDTTSANKAPILAQLDAKALDREHNEQPVVAPEPS